MQPVQLLYIIICTKIYNMAILAIIFREIESERLNLFVKYTTLEK